MKPIGFIYLTTCTVNGKIYIGKHEGSDKDKYLGSGELFSRAVKKYGKENFKREILRYCFTEHELRIWEYVLIKKYNSQDLSIGYNIADGDVNTSEFNPAKLPQVREKIRKSHIGKKTKPRSEETKQKISKALKNRKLSEETKLKISVALKGKNQYWLGKKLSEETKQKISIARKGKYCGKNNPNYGNHKIAGKNNPMFGKRHSKESRKKMSDSQKARFELSQSL